MDTGFRLCGHNGPSIAIIADINRITKIIVAQGNTVNVGAVIGEMEAGAVAASHKPEEKHQDKAEAISVSKETEVPETEEPKTSPAVRKMLAG